MSEARTDCGGSGEGANCQLWTAGTAGTAGREEREGRYPRNKVALCSVNQQKSLVRVGAH